MGEGVPLLQIRKELSFFVWHTEALGVFIIIDPKVVCKSSHKVFVGEYISLHKKVSMKLKTL